MTVDLNALGLDFSTVLDRSPAILVLLDGDGRCLFANGAACRILGRKAEELAGTHYLELFPENEHPVLEARFANPELEQFEVQVVRPDRQRRYVNGHIIRLNESVRLMAVMDRTDDVRSRLEIQAQSDIASRLTYGESIGATMDQLAANVGRATNGLAVAVMRIQEPPIRVQVVGGWNLPPNFPAAYAELLKIGYLPVALEAWRSGQPIVKRLTPEMRQKIRSQLSPDWADAVHQPGWVVAISLPLSYRQSLLGALNCYFAEESAPDERGMRFLQAIADQAAVSLENARLFAEVQDKAALEERQRLARELHDSVSQALFGIGLGTRTALKLLEVDPASAREPLNYVLSLAEAGLTEMRALIFELHPQSLESEGLVLALQKHVAALDSRHQVNMTSDLGEEPTLTATTREALYRVAQESLNNIVKHAGASAATVTLRHENGTVVLTIADDGAGFDTSREFPGHLGLTSMHERMQKIGGQLMVESAPGQGTRIRAEIRGG